MTGALRQVRRARQKRLSPLNVTVPSSSAFLPEDFEAPALPSVFTVFRRICVSTSESSSTFLRVVSVSGAAVLSSASLRMRKWPGAVSRARTPFLRLAAARAGREIYTPAR